MGEFFLTYLPDFFWGLAAFIVFVAIVLKMGIKPVIAAVDAREKKIADDLATAERTRSKAQELQASLDQELAHCEAKVKDILAKAMRDAEEQKSLILEDGRREVEAFRNRALREIEAARHEAIVDLRDEVADIATSVAERILTRELDSTNHHALVEKAIDLYEAEER